MLFQSMIVSGWRHALAARALADLVMQRFVGLETDPGQVREVRRSVADGKIVGGIDEQPARHGIEVRESVDISLGLRTPAQTSFGWLQSLISVEQIVQRRGTEDVAHGGTSARRG